MLECKYSEEGKSNKEEIRTQYRKMFEEEQKSKIMETKTKSNEKHKGRRWKKKIIHCEARKEKLCITDSAPFSVNKYVFENI